MNNTPIKILLVDDDEKNLTVLETILAEPGILLVKARKADEALLSLVSGDFAAVILDIRLPDMNGLELATIIKQRKKTQHIPILFLTAYYLEEKDTLEGYGAGAVDYLTKPVNPKILRSKITVFIELFRKTRELAALNESLEKAERALTQVNGELEGRIQERTAELTRANQAKDEFLAALSHELRTPLNPVLLEASEAAADPEVPEHLRKKFASIAKNVELEARLIDDLLDLTRISHGKLLLDKKPINIHKVLCDAISVVETDIKGKNITAHTDFSAKRNVILGDAVRLQQVFWNILKNAVKFSPASGLISVETRDASNSGNVIVKISDTGLGMTPDEIKRAFLAFSQGESEAARRKFGGLGLGLAISHSLVSFHGGTIAAESQGKNLGSSFTLEFPTVNKSEVKPSPEASPMTTNSRRSLSILLVEDHEPTLVVLKDLLTRRQFNVQATGTIAGARELSEQIKFDLVISDIGLPDGSGCALMSELKAKYGLLGIALTGYGMEADLEKVRNAGFQHHLIKPIRIESLEGILNNIMNGLSTR